MNLTPRRQDAKKFLGEFCVLARVFFVRVGADSCIGKLGGYPACASVARDRGVEADFSLD
jgi:hypothetical protein